MVYPLRAGPAGNASEPPLMQHSRLPRQTRQFRHCPFSALIEHLYSSSRATLKVLSESLAPPHYLISVVLMPSSMDMSIDEDDSSLGPDAVIALEQPRDNKIDQILAKVERFDDDTSTNAGAISNEAGLGPIRRPH